MKKQKYFLAVLIVLISIFGVACGNENESSAVIVIGEDTNQELAEKIQDAMGKSVDIVKDTEKTKATTEILIGNTNREKSQAGSKGLRENDGWIRFYDGSIVIQGSTSEKLESLANYFVENYVPAWRNGEDFPTGYEDNYVELGKYSLQSLSFDDTEIYEYSIVTKDGEETSDALMLQEHIEAMSSYKLPIISATDLKEGQKAIVFGSSEARDASAKCKELGEQEFLMEVDGDTLYLCAWDVSEEYVLAYMFLGETIGCQLNTDTPSAAVLAYTDYSFKFTTAFDGSGKFNAMCTQTAHYPVQNEFNVLQGGCTDGEYLYLVMQDQIKNSLNCVIMKVDPSNWEIVQVSDPLPIDHGNSITYLPDENQFVISNCDPDPTLVSYVKADSLELIETVKVPYTVFSYAWSQERQQFAAMGSNKVMLLTDENLKVTESFNGLASNFSNQGYVVDDEYVYVVSISSNNIHVCDWEGNWIETIGIPVGTEMESMVPYGEGDLYYTTFWNNGADVFATIFYRRLY
ncbi:MAG: hypothetical protein IJZ53_08900 [Tyzzerella sp.]|nr:hypothetical protein [Tyzzerella sp.]